MNGACHQGDGFDMDKDFLAIFNAIKADGANADYTKRGIDPLYSVGAGARIVVIGQAPGAVAEETRIPLERQVRRASARLAGCFSRDVL